MQSSGNVIQMSDKDDEVFLSTKTELSNKNSILTNKKINKIIVSDIEYSVHIAHFV